MNRELELMDQLLSLDTAARERVLAYVESVLEDQTRPTPPAEAVTELVNRDESPYVVDRRPYRHRRTHPVKLWSVARAAKRVKLQPIVLYRAMGAGKLPFTHVTQGKRKIAKVQLVDVLRWKNANVKDGEA